MSAKDTKLPWCRSTSIGNFGEEIRDAGGHLVAIAKGSPVARLEARAAYIVRACNGYPKLLEACSELIPYVGWYIKQCQAGNDAGTTVAGELARQAIEKAEALIAQA